MSDIHIIPSTVLQYIKSHCFLRRIKQTNKKKKTKKKKNKGILFDQIIWTDRPDKQCSPRSDAEKCSI